MNNIKNNKRRNRDFSRNKKPGRFSKMKRGGRTAPTIDPSRLICKATGAYSEAFEPSQSFEQMGLHQKLRQNIASKGFVNPTQIQEDTLDHLLKGRDLVGIANTGTGKTGAFLIPIIDRLLHAEQSFQTLVVVPTRELGMQIEEEFKGLSKGLGLYASSFIGGTSVGRDIKKLRRQNHLIIGTPGRLMDLAERRALQLQNISILVLDEFDRMLDIGFKNDVKKITNAMTRREQTMLFSATIDKTQKNLIDELLTNPVVIKVSTGSNAVNLIEQDIIRMPKDGDKFNILVNLINENDFQKVLIFADTKKLVDRISKKLNQQGIRSDLIHGNKSQNYRSNALGKFRRGNVKVLVATDVAARGIDVADITHVINYQLPQTFDNYVHRIGRTGRAGKKGKAFTFVD